jgi:hypothetical protein
MDLFRGLHIEPIYVALARAAVEAAAMAVLIVLALFITSAPPAAIVPFVPILLAIIRWLEGVVDQIDPAKSRRPTAE